MRKRRYAFAALVAATVVALYAVFRSPAVDFDFRQFAKGFRELHAGWLLAGLGLLSLTYLGRAIRWKIMIAPIRPDAGIWRLLKPTVIGFAAVTLFGRPGELVRPYLIARLERVPVSSQLAVWLLERIYDLLLVLIIFGIGLTQVHAHETMGPALRWLLNTGGYFVSGLGLLCVTLLVAISVFTETATKRIRAGLAIAPAKIRDRLDSVVVAFAGGMASTRRGYYVLQLIVYSGAEWVLIIACNYCILQAFPATRALTLTDNVVFMGFVAFGSAIQVPGIGGGMQVVAVLVLTEVFGLDLEAATGVAVLLWLTLYVVIVPVGLLFAVIEGVSWRSLRHIEQTPEPVSGVSSTGVEDRT